jgi:hypothetical protein
VRLSDSESSGSYTVSSIGQVRRSDASASLALCHSPITQFRIAKDGSKREIADRRPPPMAWQGISSRWNGFPPQNASTTPRFNRGQGGVTLRARRGGNWLLQAVAARPGPKGTRRAHSHCNRGCEPG